MILSRPQMLSSLGLLLAVATLLLPGARGDDLGDLVPLDDYEVVRTFDSFNSTTLLIVIAVGSVLLLGLGVALYLYDYFADTARTEPLPNPEFADYYAQSSYQNAEWASPYYR